MVNHKIENDPWVEEQLSLFVQENDWQPNRTQALAVIRQKALTLTPPPLKWWIGLPLAASVAILALFVIPASRACAQNPISCGERLWEGLQHEEANQLPAKQTALASEAPATPTSPVPEAIPAPSLPASATEKPPQSVSASGFQHFGSPSAPVTLDIYLDYQCPPCATFFSEVVPLIESEYVETGKVQLVFHDFPIPVHRYAALAARYVNTAGSLGYYKAARKQIFLTQSAWSTTGDIATQLALVLPDEVMRKVMDRMAQDPAPAESKAAAEDHVTQTPAVIAVFRGRRAIIPGSHSFLSIRSYLETLAASPQ